MKGLGLRRISLANTRVVGPWRGIATAVVYSVVCGGHGHSKLLAARWLAVQGRAGSGEANVFVSMAQKNC